MTSKITAYAVMLAFACIISSCVSDKETETYDDATITAFTFGTLKCTRYNEKTDKYYTYTYSASGFPVSINQIDKHITNAANPLTKGTDLAHMLVTITAKNGGIVAIKNLNDDYYRPYSSSDSIDFSTTRKLRVYSNDGLNSNDYTVDIVVNQEDADSFSWVRMPDSNEMKAMKQMKGIGFNGNFYVLGNDGSATSLYSSADGSSWTLCTTLPTLTATASFATNGNSLFILDGTDLYSSADGNDWTTKVTPDTPLKEIAGGYRYTDSKGNVKSDELYAIAADGTLVVSNDCGAHWQGDMMETTPDGTVVMNKDSLPASNINFIAKATKTNADVARVTVIGNAASATANHVMVWNKVVDADARQKWTFTPVLSNNSYALPLLTSLSVTEYADAMIAVGLDANKAVKMFQSNDSGITWHTESTLVIPTDKSDASKSVTFNAENAIAVIAGNDGHFLLIGAGTGHVWKGKKNKMTWKEEQKYFD